MELFIHIGTNLEYFELLNNAKLLSQGKQDRELANFFMGNFPGELAETISPQYEINFMGIREIKKKLGIKAFEKISGIYYGSDNCEYLVPTKNELEKAFDKFIEFNKNYPPHKIRTFTLVTPYIGDKMLERLKSGLEFLNSLKTKYNIEVIINDFGILNLIKNEYHNLGIGIGRLLHKQLKTPLVDTFGYKAHPAGELIKNKSEHEKLRLRKEIVKWQMKFYNSSEVGLDIYRSFLYRFKITRVAIDYMQNREELFININNNEVGIDLYYPWALIFTGRLCDTSAIENPVRGYYASDDICSRTCNRYDVSYKIKTTGYKIIQRGNAGYRSEINLDFLSYDFINNENNRLVFSPFVPV